jgi:hypothetical protein
MSPIAKDGISSHPLLITRRAPMMSASGGLRL